MFQRILVPLDGSPGAERALPVAARFARQTSGTVILLHVISPATALKSLVAGSRTEKSDKGVMEQVIADAASYLTAMLAIYAEDLDDLTTEMDIAFGTASPALSSTVRLEDVDLIVLCRHGEAGLGRWGLESVALQMIRHSPVPLLILNEHEQGVMVPDLTHPLRLFVALDGSLFAEAVLEPALQMLSQFAGPGPSELCLMRVIDLLAGGEEAYISDYTVIQARHEAERYLKAIADRLSKRQKIVRPLHITCLVMTSVDTATAILKQIEEASAPEKTAWYPLIAIATHGREGIERALLGSVAERILDRTTHPLLIVCPSGSTSSSLQPGLLVRRNS